MRSSHRKTAILIGALALAMVGTRPHTSQAWGGRTHKKISARACHNVPPEMQAWRLYAMPMIRLSIYPDIWKDQDPDEDLRHFISLDAVPWGITNASALELPRIMPPDRDADHGSLPWTTMAVFDRLVIAMRSNDWVEATRLAGALGHYVGDLNMPLHQVRNYNGQLSGQFGLHTRWESGMPGRYDDQIHAAAVPATLLDDPWQRIVDSMNRAHLLAGQILAADLAARKAVNRDYESDRYYDLLWTWTGDMFLAQITRAADDLASLWYTAWVQAGRPAIPPPPSNLPTHSVHGRPQFLPENLPWPVIFVGSLLFIGLVIVMVSLVRRKPAQRALQETAGIATPKQEEGTGESHAQ